LPRYLAAADALVLPSDAGETWGLVVNEAMACGRPAIVSDRGDVRQRHQPRPTAPATLATADRRPLSASRQRRMVLGGNS